MKKTFRISFGSVVTLSFVGLAFLATLLGLITGGATNTAFSVYKTSWLDPMQYVRLFTHVLGHMDWDHFINNILFILILGPMIEEKYGSGTFLGMILVTAVITGLCNILFFPHTALLGASSVVFMLILLSSFAYFDGKSVPLTFLLVLVLYIGREIWSAIFVEDNISHFGHIIGGLCGCGFGYLFGRQHRKS